MPIWVEVCGPCSRDKHGECQGACDCLDPSHGKAFTGLLRIRRSPKDKHRKDKKK